MWGARAWAVVGILLLGYLVLRLLEQARVVMAPLLVALVIVYLLKPVVGWLERRGVPRGVGTAIAYFGVASILAGLSAVFGPVLFAQARDLAGELPTDLEALQRRGEEAASRVGLDVQLNIDGEQVQEWLGDNRDTLVRSLSGIGSATASVVSALIVVVVGPVLAFYLLVDLPRLGRVALALVPPRNRAEVGQVATAMGQTVGGFLRGQLIVATFVGVASAAALWLVGLPLWLLVGVIAGVTNLVPFVGPFIGGGVAVLIALANGNLAQAAWAALAIFVVQQVESHVVSPLVMGKAVRLHPGAVILAVLLGGSLAGILGLLIAVPLLASLRVLFSHVWTSRVVHGEDVIGV